MTSEDVKCAIRRSSTIHLTDLELTTLDILLKYNCYDSNNKIAALHSISEKPEFDDIWDKMEANIIEVGSHCKLSDYFQTKCKDIKQTIFNRTISQENRKCILEDLFNKPDFLRDKLFCNQVRKELDLINVEENLNLARKLCGAEIPILLVDNTYTKGAYSLSTLEKADKQEKINRHNYLKIVHLLMHIGRAVLVDALKLRLHDSKYGYAFNGMKIG
ncbi:unnamed protein product [Mytilus edulis]|uniref:Uncharacterized protein n=1 Tax=Mytilus edulis TaxID=6550 RepID=A0A8S3SAJ8_MYTED|nr:unnamed protein product [Mytilus edulis]